jgi:hypothetical protein
MGAQRAVGRACLVAAVSLWIASSSGCGSDSGNKDAGVDKPGNTDTGVDGTALDGTAVDGTAIDGTAVDGTVIDGAGSDVRDAASLDHQIPEVGTDGSAQSPMNLTATVLVRRQTSFRLAWIAPATNGQRVSGYVVRAAKVPITEANFDDVAKVTTDILYSNTPAMPGAADGVNAENLYIETGYYFAVAAVDASNARGPIAATTTAVKATFNATSLTGTNGAMEQFGFEFDSGDADTNGISDLLVGSFTGKRAYLFLNHMNLPATAASVTFTGDATTTASFGRGVAFIGDIDDDGMEDLAVSDRGTSAHIYIYKGRQTWPAALANTDANYVITVDATYDGSIFGAVMARLGDFNGDGVDDFAIGANLFGATMQSGRVVIVLGKVGFASFALPNAANTIVIEGDPAVTTPQFGYRVVGLGHFYSGTGTTLVASAPGNTASATGNEGRLYAFHGQTGSAGAISSATANNIAVGPAGNNRIGAALANLGPMINGLPSLGSGNPVERVTTANGNAYVFSGSPTTGPFASKVVVYQAGAALSGMALVGGSVSGRDESFSLIGDPTPDLVMIPRDSGAFVIVDGRTVRTAASPIDANVSGSVSIPMPADWVANGEAQGTLIPDVDGDGYPDFAVGNAIGTVPGRVIAYW